MSTRLTDWLLWRAFRALRFIAFASGAAAVELGLRVGAFDKIDADVEEGE